MVQCLGHNLQVIDAGPFRVSETVHAPDLVLPLHEHSSACIHCILEGLYVESVRNETFRFARRHLLFKPAGLSHCNRFEKSGARSLRVEFSPDRLEAVDLDLPSRLISRSSPAACELAGRILSELRYPDAHTPMVVEGQCLELLALVLRCYVASTPRDSKAGRGAIECADYLRASFRNPVSFTELSTSLGVNRTQLSMAFRRIHGCPMGEYLRRLRVAYVMNQIDTGNRPLARVALDAGFADQSHCTRTFKRIVGLTPGEWRKRLL